MVDLVLPSVVEQAWTAFVTQSGLPIVDEAQQVARTFMPEVRRYCELIQGPGSVPVGLMTRGEDVSFTERAQTFMESWDMPAQGIAHYLSLAELFEHKRAFLKLEWQKTEEAEQVERLMAFYFRRRPSVRKALEYLGLFGVHTSILERAAQLANLLDKESVHFVSGSLRPGTEVRHKLYFSQYVTPERYETVLSRLLKVIEWFDVAPEARTQVAQCHNTLVPPDRIATVFVSISFTNTMLIPSIKIDYPNVSPPVCVSLLPSNERTSAEMEVQKLCAITGLEDLSYLGVRLFQAEPLSLKYYADFQWEED